MSSKCSPKTPQSLSKTRPEHKRAPREPPRPIRTKLTHPSGLHFGAEIRKNVKKSAFGECLFADPIFSSIFEPIRGLPGQGPHAIYTRRRDRNTFLHFSSRPQKSHPNDLQKSPFWQALDNKIASNADCEGVEKEIPKKKHTPK